MPINGNNHTIKQAAVARTARNGAVSDARVEEVQVIIGRMPHWVIRWGITIIGLLVLLLFIIAYFFKYPDTVQGRLSIQALQQPVPLYAPDKAMVAAWLVANHTEVKEGQAICMLSNTAEYSDIQLLMQIVNKYNNNNPAVFSLPAGLKVGSLQTAYTNLYTALQQATANKQPGMLKRYVDDLQTAYAAWQQQYLVKAPVSGVLYRRGVLNNYSGVQKNDTLATILPPIREMHAVVHVPVNGSGNIREGQKVLLRLSSYPDKEYGMLEASVADIAPFNTGDTREVNLSLQHGLQTTAGKTILMQPQLDGTAEILTDDRSILARLLNRLW